MGGQFPKAPYGEAITFRYLHTWTLFSHYFEQCFHSIPFLGALNLQFYILSYPNYGEDFFFSSIEYFSSKKLFMGYLTSPSWLHWLTKWWLLGWSGLTSSVIFSSHGSLALLLCYLPPACFSTTKGWLRLGSVKTATRDQGKLRARETSARVSICRDKTIRVRWESSALESGLLLQAAGKA